MNKNLTNLWNLSKAQSQPAPEASNVQETVQENENTDAAASTITVDQEPKVKKRTKSSLSGSSKRVRSMFDRFVIFSFANPTRINANIFSDLIQLRADHLDLLHHPPSDYQTWVV
jgi:hypothetical protein